MSLLPQKLVMINPQSFLSLLIQKKCFNTGKAPGIDGISAKVLQSCAGLSTSYSIYALIRALSQMSDIPIL